jgi:hypothetical protein
VKLTYAELARDFILAEQDELDELMRLTPKHLVQRWHRKRTSTIFEQGNYRTGKRASQSMIIQVYGDAPSKVTGE